MTIPSIEITTGEVPRSWNITIRDLDKEQASGLAEKLKSMGISSSIGYGISDRGSYSPIDIHSVPESKIGKVADAISEVMKVGEQEAQTFRLQMTSFFIPELQSRN